MQGIAQKIAKLIEKADSSTHPEEADTFMAKANELMRKHGLNLMELGRLSEDPVDAQRNAFTTSATYPWMRRVVSALAAYYGCRLVYYKSGNTIVYDVVGRESARITLILMVPFVQRQIQKLAKDAYNKGVYSTRMKAVTAIGNATCLRIWGMVERDPLPKGTGVNALVPVDIIAQVLEEAFPRTRKARKTTITSPDGYAREAAKSVSVNRQATGGSAKLLGK